MATIRCDQMRVLAALEPDGSLSETERKRLDAHLAGCPSCHAFHGRALALVETMRGTPPEAAPSCMWPRSARHGSDARRRPCLPSWTPMFLTTSGVAVSILAAVLVGRATGDPVIAPVGGPVIIIDVSAVDNEEALGIAARDYANRRTTFGGDPPPSGGPGLRSD